MAVYFERWGELCHRWLVRWKNQGLVTMPATVTVLHASLVEPSLVVDSNRLLLLRNGIIRIWPLGPHKRCGAKTKNRTQTFEIPSKNVRSRSVPIGQSDQMKIGHNCALRDGGS